MTLTAADLMTGEVQVAHAAWSVGRLVDFLTEHGISGAPVVSEDGRLIGVVSLTDVARSAHEARPRPPGPHAHDCYLLGPAYTHRHPPRDHVDATRSVRDIMTPAVFDVPLGATAKEIAEVMLSLRIHRVFVTESGMVIGVISAFDMLRAVASDPQ